MVGRAKGYPLVDIVRHILPFFHVLLSGSCYIRYFLLYLLSCSLSEFLASVVRTAGRYFTITALILQIAGLWGCNFLIKNPYGLSTSFRRHAVPDELDAHGFDGTCQAFGTIVGAYEGISLNDGSLADATYQFAKWMTYIATILGLVAVFSDCTMMSGCPCRKARSRSMQIKVVGGLQMAVGAMLGLSFAVLESDFCTEPWADLEDGIADSGGTVPDGPHSCSLAWGGVCVAVSTALWIAAAFMTLGKGRRDRMEEEKKEEVQADAEAQRSLGK